MPSVAQGIGHLFGARYKSPRVDTDAAFIRVIGYIAANPVTACLCKRLEEWPWASHALVMSHDGAPPWLAHRRLVDRLEDITTTRCYVELVTTYARDPY